MGKRWNKVRARVKAIKDNVVGFVENIVDKLPFGGGEDNHTEDEPSTVITAAEKEVVEDFMNDVLPNKGHTVEIHNEYADQTLTEQVETGVYNDKNGSFVPVPVPVDEDVSVVPAALPKNTSKISNDDWIAAMENMITEGEVKAQQDKEDLGIMDQELKELRNKSPQGAKNRNDFEKALGSAKDMTGQHPDEARSGLLENNVRYEVKVVDELNQGKSSSK